MNRLLVALTAISLLLSVSPAFAGDTVRTTTRTYTPTDRVLTNPERGFYHHTETHYYANGTGYDLLDLEQLRTYRTDENITLVLRLFYLEKFAQQDQIDEAYLDLMRQDFATLRRAGIKAVVRFAYAKPSGWPPETPYGDAPLDRVLSHIDQLTPVLRENSDVISVVQAGFIGLWGEWYYTDHFVADPSEPGNITDADMAKRREVVFALLDALPADRMIQIRTPNYKQRVFGVPTGHTGALKPHQAYDGSRIARVGHHNDCFLASPDDFGTYVSDPIELDKEYLARDTRYTPMGGETCAVNPPRSLWQTAAEELSRFHFSYLNTDYNQDVLDSWGDNIVTAQRRLGYRFALTEGTFTNGVKPDRRFAVQLKIRNNGWAAPYNPRDMQLILRGDTRSYMAKLPADPRFWEPGSTTRVKTRICAPAQPGKYDLYLNLADPDHRLHSQELMPGGTQTYNAAYAIQLANTGTWQPGTGYNDLGHTLVVGHGESGSGTCKNALPLAPLP